MSPTSPPAASGGPIVHLLCGLPGSGKTTFAIHLAATRPAIRFTLDAWMRQLYDYTFDMPDYGHYVPRCQEVIWQTGQAILALGHDIVLDWSLWSRGRRQMWTSRVIAAGFQYHLYYINVPLSVVQVRLRTRNLAHLRDAHVIDEAELLRFAPYFEVPTFEEGLAMTEITDNMS